MDWCNYFNCWCDDIENEWQQAEWEECDTVCSCCQYCEVIE